MQKETVTAEINQLIDRFESLQLATISPNGEPEISYSPYVRVNHCFYIFISELASHTKNIIHNPSVSVGFFEPEEASKNIFARRRLTIQCQCQDITPESDTWRLIMPEFHRQRGKTVALLQSLPDFHLFCLTPTAATWVVGFGKAYALSGKELQNIKHISKDDLQ